jgi:hypothetical protein
MKLIGTIVGVVMVLLGAVWAMQGLHVGPAAIMRGFMVGDRHWTLYGAVLAIAGLVLIVWSQRRPAKT